MATTKETSMIGNLVIQKDPDYRRIVFRIA